MTALLLALALLAGPTRGDTLSWTVPCCDALTRMGQPNVAAPCVDAVAWELWGHRRVMGEWPPAWRVVYWERLGTLSTGYVAPGQRVVWARPPIPAGFKGSLCILALDDNGNRLPVGTGGYVYVERP